MEKIANNTVSATQARIHFGSIIKEAYLSHEPVVVEKNGIPVVVILSFHHYERLRQEARLARFEQLSRAAGLDAVQQGLSEEQLEREMDEIRQELYQKADA